MKTTNPALATILTRRLAWIAIAVVLINAIAVAAYYGSDQHMLEGEAIEQAIDRLESALSGTPPRIDQSARALFKDHPEDYAFALLDQNGLILDGENTSLIPTPATETGIFAQDWVTRLSTADGQILVAAHKIDEREDQLRLVFVMAGDPAGLLPRALIEEFVKHIWLPILPVALILIAANAFMIRRGLKPVASASRWARSIRPGMPEPALPDSPLPAEILDLVEATQRSLKRVNTALAAEKRHAAEMAHALRTPVAVLMARLDALPPGETTDQLSTDLSALSRTIRQVLAGGRADALDLPDDIHTDLVPISNSVVAALAPLAYDHGLELSLNIVQPSVIVIADPNAVEVALTNLIENAILHGRAGLVEITVGPGPEIRVRDHGHGVSAGDMRSMFAPFWRGDGAPPGGTGLGLAIVERLQCAQGGTVEVNSPKGAGAEFVLVYRSTTI